MHLSEQEIRNRLSAARLPAMPHILGKLMEQCQNEDAGMSELAKLVSQDAGMTGKILSVAHSSAYHRGGQKVGLEQSLLSLGIDMIKTLVISESVFQTFNNFDAFKNLDLRGFWKHSLAAAIIARRAAKKMGYPNIDEAYLAGLLHDIGRLALLVVSPQAYAFHFQTQDDENLCAVEQRLLQITHSEAGSLLIERWRLDSFIADSVLYHHEPADRIETAHPLIRIVYLAHLLASQDEHAPAIESAVSRLGIDRGDVHALTEGVADEINRAADCLGIALEDVGEIPEPDSHTHQTPAQERLNQEIHNLVHASELGRYFSGFHEETELRKAVCRSAHAFFQLDNAFLLLHDDKHTLLKGCSSAGAQQRLAGFSIPFRKGNPIADSALLKRVIVLSLNDKLTGIAEEQLLRILGTERLVCVPLVTAEYCAGVLIGGAASWQMRDLQQYERQLKTFGAQAATALRRVGGKEAARQDHAEHIEEQYRDASRRVAHEVNNPLSIIKNYLRVLNNKLARKEPISGEMSILNEEIDRVGEIINDFAEHPTSASNSTADMNRVIDDVVRLFRDTEFAPRTVHIAARMQGKPCVVASSPTVLKQIMVNLIKNAVEAMPEGGEISIVNKGKVNKGDRLYIELSVSDTGPGIPKSILDNLFVQVGSTKGAGHQGLGLSIVQNLVKKIQGQIICHSDTGGTVFEILIPVPASPEPIIENKLQAQFFS
jgi:HD-like signal output (HDOD) protein/signal transduction histidine kinase